MHMRDLGIQERFGQQDGQLSCVALQAHIWQLDFAVSPRALDEVKAEMRNNEEVLRWAIVKRGLPTLPSPRRMFHRLSEHAVHLRPPPKHGQQLTQ